ncbi:MAG: HlyD family secretion protein [Bacteriovoracia bacterium]
MMTSQASNSSSTAHSHSKTGWWKDPRAKRMGKIGVLVSIVGVVTWYFVFFPYIRTDDARIAATLVRVAPEGIFGRIVKLNVREGDHVKAGQVLLELEHTVFEANLTKAKANAFLAEKELKRIELLAAQNGVPPREVDKVRAVAQIARADLDLAQINYDRTFLKTPIDGVVVQKIAEVGNILEQNQTAITIADIDRAWVSANIEETAVAHVKPGQPVKISVDEGGDLTGRVQEIRAATASQFALIQSENPAGNFTKLVQRIPIKIELEPHSEVSLRTGQSVEIKIRVR